MSVDYGVDKIRITCPSRHHELFHVSVMEVGGVDKVSRICPAGKSRKAAYRLRHQTGYTFRDAQGSSMLQWDKVPPKPGEGGVPKFGSIAVFHLQSFIASR